jgi:hypothetical protein
MRQWIISGFGTCGRYVEKRSSLAVAGSPRDLENEAHFSLMYVNAQSSTLESITHDGGSIVLRTWMHQ